MSKKSIILIIALIVSVGCLVGGTTAWLVAQSEEVVNTFTVGNIDIELNETDAEDGKKSFKMVPGDTIDKDPTVTVKANSEDCWLFVEINKSTNFDNFLTYEMDDDWIVLDASNYPGVYYMKVFEKTDPQVFSVLKDDKVTVLDTVTKQMMDALADDTLPTLTFKAYAVQKASFDTALLAWGEASK